MKTLIIYAHPATKGHCSSILEEVQEQLKERKQNYDLIDLYKIKYDPVLHEEEHYTAGNYKISAQNKKFQEMITKTDKIIIIFPVWWSGMPAIMKGFFDKVFTNHYAFRYVKKPVLSQINQGPIPEGLLKGKKAVIFATTGAKKWQTKIFQGSRFKKTLANDILRFCGIKSKTFQLGFCVSNCETREKEIIKLVHKGLKYLD